MHLIPRVYQSLTANHAIDFLRSAKRGDKLLIASPTGSGKSVIELLILDQLSGSWLVTPRIEIVKGLLEKRGIEVGMLSRDKLEQLAYSHRIATPIKYRNAMMRGEVEPPQCLIWDECHHQSSESWGQIETLTGCCPAVGFTATPFRGTPKSTAKFRETWGEPFWVMRFDEAVRLKVITMPHCSIVPLLDDDIIKANNGEFVIESVAAETASRIENLADLIASYFDGRLYDTPTMVAVPTRENAIALCRALAARQAPSGVVDGETPYPERQSIFGASLARERALISIRVVSEGVDLPMRRLVDALPTLSPVDWLQRFGRITRPGGVSHYVCTNRNLLRHGYLTEGMIPETTFAEHVKAFGGLGTRSAMRVLGLEGLGRFKETNVPLRNGSEVTCFMLTATENNRRVDYGVIVLPNEIDPIWTKKESYRDAATDEIRWGEWSECEQPGELTGFGSMKPSPMSDKQRAWWKKSASRYGLDAKAEVNARQFAILPILHAINRRVG